MDSTRTGVHPLAHIEIEPPRTGRAAGGRRSGRGRIAALVVALVAALLGAVTPAAAQGDAEAAQVGPDIILVEGRANGHGRGLGQFGALGYAIDFGWDHTRILDHFYGNTTMGTVADEDLLVHLSRFDDRNLVLTSDRPFVVDERVRVEPGQAARIDVAGDGIFDISTGPSCDGPWTPTQLVDWPGDVGRGAPGDERYIEAVPVEPNYGNDMTGVLIACGTANERGYRGTLRLIEQGGVGVTVNKLPMEQYLRGVVPHESPPGWGLLPGKSGIDKGIHALNAQAVAARSYALNLARSRRAAGRASDTCDTQACQVYQGAWAGTRSAAGRSGTPQDHGSRFDPSNLAIRTTAGQVRLHADGSVALTEFSSSTGGYTSRRSEGNGFPAVEDLGDATVTLCRLYPDEFSCNPFRPWVKEISRTAIEQAYPQIGTFLSIRVTKRNGLGDWGGRVQQITIDGTAGRAVVDIANWSGDPFRTAFGLRSDWYRFPQFEGGSTRSGGDDGFWTVKANGEVGAWGSAEFHGDTRSLRLVRPVVAAASSSSGRGYWLAASDGGVFTFGDARFHGSAGGIALWQPVVGMAPTAAGGGYWLVASDGGVFTYGDASFVGSMGGIPLVSPVVGMAATPTGRGYWLVASDGGVFTFGDAPFHGSAGGQPRSSPIVGMAATADGRGYWLVDSTGRVFTYGTAVHRGDRTDRENNGTVVGIAARSDGGGYWIITDNGTSYPYGNIGDHPSSLAGAGVVTVAASR